MLLRSRDQAKSQKGSTPRRAHLWNVSETRVAVAKFPLFHLIQSVQPVIALTSRPDLVLADDVEDAENGEQRHANLGHQVDRVADGVVWRVG